MDLAGCCRTVVFAVVVVVAAAAAAASVTSSCWVDSNWCPSYLLTYQAASATGVQDNERVNNTLTVVMYLLCMFCIHVEHTYTHTYTHACTTHTSGVR